MSDVVVVYLLYSVGAYGGEGPPVPIPNTEVKLTCAEDTWMVTSRENRSVPTRAKQLSNRTAAFFMFIFCFSTAIYVNTVFCSYSLLKRQAYSVPRPITVHLKPLIQRPISLFRSYARSSGKLTPAIHLSTSHFLKI